MLLRLIESNVNHFVPDSFLQRAVAHIEQTGEPLLYRRLPSYAHTLEAWPEEDGGYNLNVPWDDWNPPFRTWRQYAKYKRVTATAMMTEQGFDDSSELDEDIDDDVLHELIPRETSMTGQAVTLLGDLPKYEIADPGDFAKYITGTLVEIWENDGSYPGDAYMGHLIVTVPSALELSILQYVLDELGRRIKLELKS